MNRRTAISVVSRTVAAGAGYFASTLPQASLLGLATALEPSAEAETPEGFEAKLQADMTLLAKRVYSEEGIPMILGCEDLTAKAPVAPASRAMNLLVAPAFQKYAEAWLHLHPDAPVGDVAKLLELLAYRDFAGGGKDNNL